MINLSDAQKRALKRFAKGLGATLVAAAVTYAAHSQDVVDLVQPLPLGLGALVGAGLLALEKFLQPPSP